MAELYRRRWQVELFCTWIKQHLKLKACYGTSGIAVLIQVWTALIAFLLLLRLKLKSKVHWGLLGLTRLAPTMLLEPCDIRALLYPKPPEPKHPWVFNFCAGN